MMSIEQNIRYHLAPKYKQVSIKSSVSNHRLNLIFTYNINGKDVNLESSITGILLHNIIDMDEFCCGLVKEIEQHLDEKLKQYTCDIYESNCKTM